MGIYSDFWQKIVNRVVKDINPAVAFDTSIEIPELSQIGQRPAAGFNGRLFTWAGRAESITDSSIFRNLAEVIAGNSNLKNIVPGLLQFRIYGNSILKVNYQPISFELLIERYKKILAEKKKAEIEKWRLIKLFQSGWNVYKDGGMSFTEFWKQINFGHLVFHTGLTVFAQVVKEKPAAFEQLLLNLYDETKDLKSRIAVYTSGFRDLYSSLDGHGKNTFQEERTIATLLAFRYPEKYPLFKDSFYTKLSKGLGIKPYATGEKLFHYYSLVEDFIKNVLSNHYDIIEEKNTRLDDTCYSDNNNLILAQDILYLTLDAKELADTDEEPTDETDEQPIKEQNIMKHSLNTILYGPPGTGKTYHTINRAVAITNPQFNIAAASRLQIKQEYERLIKEGQVEFITFHQSMNYEDFIEGIKPVEPKEEDDFLKYEIKDGIFKRLCERASKVPEAKPTGFSIAEDDFQKASFYKISLGDTSNPDDDQIFEWCINNGYIALGWGDAIDFSGKAEIDIQQMAPSEIKPFAATAINSFIHYLKTGNFVIVSYGNHQFRAIGKVTGNYEYKNVDGLNVHQFRKVEWLVKDIELPYEEVYDRQFSQQSIYRMDKKGIKKDFFIKAGNTVPVDNKVKNYVLIIDEINRGNVSQIFGELITLIEEDKRAGEDEALTATLPYSKKAFSVPPNLYIIGTMNTADRSVEALDTALRRRFSFAEMQPEPEILSPYRLLQRLWMKHWLAEPGSKEWEPWELEEQNFIEFSGMVHDLTKYEALAKKYEKEGKEAEWMAANAEDLFGGIVSFKDGVNLSELLNKINSRLKVLVSKDHTIGHAWLMNVFSLEDLRTTFRDKIIPLLQEFFYNDYAKIGLVLGEQFIEPKPVKTDLFAKFKGSEELAGDYTDKIIYELKDIAEIDLQGFKSIYTLGQ